MVANDPIGNWDNLGLWKWPWEDDEEVLGYEFIKGKSQDLVITLTDIGNKPKTGVLLNGKAIKSLRSAFQSGSIAKLNTLGNLDFEPGVAKKLAKLTSKGQKLKLSNSTKFSAGL